ncbi:MAG: UDP-N-acetylglucosamine 2-epimerase (non-hydrolyzing) [bacterium]
MANKLHVLSVVGARPSFVKVAPIARALKKHNHIKHTIIHTGQHYDKDMSASFFEVMEIPKPDFDLGVGSGSHGAMTGAMMRELEQILISIRPDWIITYGASNSTLAAALTAAKLNMKSAHIESGLRSGDMSMPEEINRKVADVLSTIHFVTEQAAVNNLLHEGISKEKIHLVGNVIIDALITFLPKIEQLRAWNDFGVEEGSYLVATMHQPYNVDDKHRLKQLVGELLEIEKTIPILFPLHPRTSMRLQDYGLMELLMASKDVRITAPQDYLHFLSLIRGARGLITDSGGIAEETTYLGVPCLTLRPSVERPVTVELGTNEHLSTEKGAVIEAVTKLLGGHWKKGEIPPFWDGKSAERSVKILLSQ